MASSRCAELRTLLTALTASPAPLGPHRTTLREYDATCSQREAARGRCMRGEREGGREGGREREVTRVGEREEGSRRRAHSIAAEQSASSPPSIEVSVPPSAPVGPPDTGASTNRPPHRSRRLAASARDAAGSPEVQSTTSALSLSGMRASTS